MNSYLVQVVSYAGLLIAVAALLYSLYCLLRVIGAGIRILARLDALWLVPLSMLGLDRLFQSEARRALKDNARHWMWRSVMAAVLCAAGLVVWAATSPPVQRTCTYATMERSVIGCAPVAKVVPDTSSKR